MNLGYGSDTARETMNDEVDQAERRWTMLDRLIAALSVESRDDFTWWKFVLQDVGVGVGTGWLSAARTSSRP